MRPVDENIRQIMSGANAATLSLAARTLVSRSEVSRIAERA